MDVGFVESRRDNGAVLTQDKSNMSDTKPKHQMQNIFP